jgi:hypothetical protein
MPFVIFEKYSTYFPSIVARIRCSNISAVTEHWGTTNLTFLENEECGSKEMLGDAGFRAGFGSVGGVVGEFTERKLQAKQV